MSSSIVSVAIEAIDENPHRQLATYPTIKAKVDALVRSIEDVGMWETIIARESPDNPGRYQLAFGHHRLEAAKQVGLRYIPLIVRELDDHEMLQFMGRENGEDYATEFLIMLNTWEGAARFLYQSANTGDPETRKLQSIDIAKELGWFYVRSERKDQLQMSAVAKACDSAYRLIQGGHIARSDLEGLSVKAAREITQRAVARLDQLDKSAKVANVPKKSVDAGKKLIATAVKNTADQIRQGTVAQKDLKTRVDVNAYKAAATSKVKDTPLFDVFGKALADTLNKMLDRDSASEKLREVAKAINNITLESDHAVVRQLDFELGEISTRAENWKKKLIPTSKKVSPFPAMEHKNGS